MVQLPVYLHPLPEKQIGKFIDSLNPSPGVQEWTELLRSVLEPNPRRIKRILNILALANLRSQSAPLGEKLDPSIVARLTVIQVQHAELYAEVIRWPELLVALEQAYGRAVGVGGDEHYTEFGTASRAQQMRALTERHYSTDDRFKSLFTNAGFTAARSDLEAHLTVVGGI